jgi:hypothetical protein
LEAVQSVSDGLPNLVIHGSKLKYPPPVIAHIVPQQEAIRRGIEMWGRALPRVPSENDLKVVVAAMRPDNVKQDFEAADCDKTVNLREERVAKIIAGIRAAGLEPQVEWIEDYGASGAYALIENHSDARGYVCLSDEVAVAVKHLLLARGEQPDHRIIGFDGSSLAKKHGIPSFSQRLNDIGEMAIEQLLNWLRLPQESIRSWPPLREVEIDVNLSPPL